MLKGRLKNDITNTVLDHTFTLGYAGEEVYIHEEQEHATVYEVSSERNPSMNFYVRRDQVELLQ